MALLVGLIAAPAATAKAGKGNVGSRSLNDPLLPQLGNGGYDAKSYRIKLNYDPAANEFSKARTKLVAKAKKKLKKFSLDFQDLDVSRVTVNGKRARFRQVEAEPDLSDNPEVTQPMKLIVKPKPQARPKRDRKFKVSVRYSGTPEHITDPDTSIEGWIRACFPLDPPQTCDGSFVVNEPMGAQSWFPSNNYPTDKAKFDTLIRVPDDKTALGVGELERQREHADGTTTWHWHEDDPTATYLTTATVGDFIFSTESMTESSTGRTLPVYNAIDATATQAQLDAINATLAEAPGQLNFLSDILGPYPFDSTGAVADRAAGVGYALEVQTKPHYAGGFTSGNPNISISTQLHELAHQWAGNSVTLERWSDIGFNEGWATWFEWQWGFLADGGDDPAQIFDDLYANTPDEDWAIAPAILDGDPANLFVGFPVYDRTAMTIQGYREIVGDETFFEFVRALSDEFAYGNISTEEYIAFALDFSGFAGDDLALLDDYFQQWLYATAKPTILPDDFG
jgi:aminopeptidase N